jgi:hypothetical protein
VNAAQVEHGLRAFKAPAHTSAFHAVFNEMAACPFKGVLQKNPQN